DAQKHRPRHGRLAAGLADPGVGLFQFQRIHQLAGQQVGVARILDLHLAEHLADDDLDVLVVDLHALHPVDPLDLLQQVKLHAPRALDLEDVVGVGGALGQLVAGHDPLAVLHPHPGAEGHRVRGHGAVVAGDADLPAALLGDDADHALVLGDDRLALGLAGLEQLLHPRQALGDVLGGHAAGVEGAHGELRARLADGLGRDDADGLTHLHQAPGGQVAPVAAGADAQPRPAGQHRADVHFLDAGRHDGLGGFLGDLVIGGHDDLAGFRMHDVAQGHAADDPVLQRLNDVVAVADLRHRDAAGGAAVL